MYIIKNLKRKILKNYVLLKIKRKNIKKINVE